MRYDTGAPSDFFFSLPLLLHSLSRARSNNQVFTQLCNDGVPTVRSSRQRASVRVSVGLLVGTGADRKITTADRCSASVCLHFSNFAPTHTHTLHLCTECVCILARSSIRRRSSRRYCGVVPILGSLASHAHYHGAATVLAAVFVCTCCVCFIAPLDVMVLVALDEHPVADRKKGNNNSKIWSSKTMKAPLFDCCNAFSR